MSRLDFCQCTPAEFKAIYDKWNEKQQQEERTQWEQTRALCRCMLQPHSKKSLKATDVMKFPWDEKPREKIEEEELTPEERKARYEAAKKRYGITT